MISMVRHQFLQAGWLKRFVACVALGAVSFFSTHAQTATSAAPDWQQRAAEASKLAFETASIRPSEPGNFTPPNLPLSPDEFYVPTAGRFTADFPLAVYIEFAYKFPMAPSQRKAMVASLPKWVAEQSFTIHAQAEGNPTKDQMRLMVQSLLAERFGLRVHFESQVTPVLSLVLAKPGKTGPQLRSHAEGPRCEADKDLSSPTPGSGKVFPPQCHIFMGHPGENGQMEFGSRDVPIALLATMMPTLEDQGFAIVDGTGLSGNYDFTLHFLPQNHLSQDIPAPEGPEFPTALNEQLGLKLKRITAPLNVLVIDHVEEPTPN